MKEFLEDCYSPLKSFLAHTETISNVLDVVRDTSVHSLISTI